MRVALAFALAAIAPSVARASKPRCHLERIDASRLASGRLSLYASVVELEGQPVESLAPAQFTLLVDGKPRGGAIAARPFADAGEELDLALVVEVAAPYAPALPSIKPALRELLDGAPPRTRALLIPFGSNVARAAPLSPAPALAQSIDDLAPDEDSVEIRLVDAVRAALAELRKLDPKEPDRPPPRRSIVVVSDGIDARMERAVFRRLGDDAARAGIPIDAIAFSPVDERGPLLNLGELSKRSHGTFRWARTPADIAPQLKTLGDELNKQYVLTFPAPLASLDGHRLSLRCDDLESNTLEANDEANAASVVGRRNSIFIALALAASLALSATLFITLRRRRAKPPLPPTKAIARNETAGGRQVLLIGINGALATQRFPIDRTLSLGKLGDNAVVIADDPTVSSRHAELSLDKDGCLLRDLGSTNGTFVNNQRVQGSRRLQDGDVVRLGGNTQFKVRIG